MEHDWKWNEESRQWELDSQPEENSSDSYSFSQELKTEEIKTEQKKPKKVKNHKILKKIALTAGCGLLFGLIAGITIVGVQQVSKIIFDEPETSRVVIPDTDIPFMQEPLQLPQDQPLSTTGQGVAEVAENCMPSVVSITNASVTRVQDFFGGYLEQPVETTGSGIIVGQNEVELLIATNNHVVEGGETLTVAFSDESVYEATPKGEDKANDLAVIAVKIEDMSKETLSTIRIVKIGDSGKLRIGEQVVAIGNALGYGQSVTSGYVSALGRKVQDEMGNISGELIQTDTAINHGNSGGPLLNMNGELIGINSAKMEGELVENMGYAIPVSTALPILDELMNRETRYKVTKDKAAYIGVTCLNVEQSAVAMYGIPQGAFIDTVEPDGPADKAGLLKGDVIKKFDGITILGGTDLVDKLVYYEAGEKVEIVIERAQDGRYVEKTVTITLGKRSEMKKSVRNK